jgi:predicted metalloprotease
MEIEGRKRSDNFEDRGRGGGGGAGGLPINALLSVVRMLGPKGAMLVAAVLGVGYFVLPSGLRQQLLGALNGEPGATQASGAGSACKASADNAKACDFSRVVLASTEDVWTQKFQSGAIPQYGRMPEAYEKPTLAVFVDSVSTGCGSANSAVGPFYCPRDRKLYIDPNFYGVMEKRLRAPGDFAQAYVIAHEVGHHVQNLIGATTRRLKGETENQNSVRVELQADCLAGVWGHTARSSLAITDEDLREAVNAAHAIGDDTLGHSNTDDYTHGSSAQRMRWFKRGFESGDARHCDTFQVANQSQL